VEGSLRKEDSHGDARHSYRHALHDRAPVADVDVPAPPVRDDGRDDARHVRPRYELRWALYESAQAACRPTSPDRADYLALKARGLSHTRASLTISRKLARRCFHTLRELGPQALEPVT
jgi:hypothetical protein